MFCLGNEVINRKCLVQIGTAFSGQPPAALGNGRDCQLGRSCPSGAPWHFMVLGLTTMSLERASAQRRTNLNNLI